MTNAEGMPKPEWGLSYWATSGFKMSAIPISLMTGIQNSHVTAQAAVLGGVPTPAEDGGLSNRALRNPFSRRKRVSPGRT